MFSLRSFLSSISLGGPQLSTPATGGGQAAIPLRHRSLARKAMTLLELLVVVAILAILAGAVLVAYDGLESQAAKGTATFSISGVDRAVRTFTVSERSAPNRLDSLLAADYVAGGGTGLPGSPLTGVQTNAVDIFILGSKLAGKLTPTALTAGQVTALTAAGITELRVIDVKGNLNPTANTTLDAFIDDGLTAAVIAGPSTIDIPNRIFDTPRNGTNARGRGYSMAVAAGQFVQVWNAGTNGVDNIKVGAGASDVLVAFGVGNMSTLVGATDSANGVGNATLAEAPFYGDVAKGEYGRYIALYNLGTTASPATKAKLQAVVDPRGDFLDEEYAESSGQKK